MSTLVPVTNVATIFSYKPNEDWVPDTAYMYFDCTNSNNTEFDNYWEAIRKCELNIYVVWPSNDPTRLDESVVDDVINIIDEELITYICDSIDQIDDVRIQNITSRRDSPMWYTNKNRPIKVKTYDILYSARQ